MDSIAARGVARWHDCVARRDFAALKDLLADDVRFHSPFLWRPKEGKDITAAYLIAAVHVLESFTCPTAAPCFPSPGSGRVVQIAANGTRSVVASGLSVATALRMGPDGALYVSNFGFGPPASGQIIRIVP